MWQHNTDFVLGRTKSGTLKLWEDDHGLAFEILPPNTQFARDALASIQRGDVDQMSFGFETMRDRWGEDDAGGIVRDLIEVELLDVSPATFPAYPQTSVAVRSKASELQRQRAHLNVLRRRLLLELAL